MLKDGNASTLSVVKGIRGLLPARAADCSTQSQDHAAQRPKCICARGGLRGDSRGRDRGRADRADDPAVSGQLADRRIIIAISIPLSILTSVIVLSLMGETINTMTLGGLALAVGILVDDATVTIENIERFLENGYELREAILEGAAQIAVPALVSTLCICIVFLPMFFLERRGALSVCAAGRGGHVCHACHLYSFPHTGAHAGDVSAARPRSTAALAQSAGAFPTRL